MVDDGATVGGSNALSGAVVRHFEAAALCLSASLHLDGPCSRGISALISSRILQNNECFYSPINNRHRRAIIVPFAASWRHHKPPLTKANDFKKPSLTVTVPSRATSPPRHHLRRPQLTTKSIIDSSHSHRADNIEPYHGFETRNQGLSPAPPKQNSPRHNNRHTDVPGRVQMHRYGTTLPSTTSLSLRLTTTSLLTHS